MLALLVFLACGDKDADDTGATDGGAIDGGATDGGAGDGGAGQCDPMRSGTDWAWDGQCPMMVTPCDIVVDGCSLTIDYEADGGMTMGMPYTGTISGDQISFEDGDSVDGCTGTLIDPDTVEGSCAGGCTFTLTR